jgi:2-C-methyl-D-erythritol 2,4-cyclodiphosphate synthase
MGLGWDVHRLSPGRPLILGGVTVPSEFGLEGHSDADVLAHAITDAILGAAALGDIGAMFSDTDPANRGRDSIEMLRLAVGRLHHEGWRVGQVDVVVVAETPKIGPHRDAMRARIAGALDVDRSCVSIKGKTNEGMGWVGRGEGIACMATATIVRG